MLAMALAEVTGLRVQEFVADASRPPVAVIGQPDVDWTDPETGWCMANWEFPITLIVARNSDREAQAQLSRLVAECGQALQTFQVAGVFIQPLDARPTVATISGQDLPAYLLRVQVRA